MFPVAPDDIDGEFLIKTFLHRIDEIANRDDVKASDLKAALETYLKLEERERVQSLEDSLPPFEPELFGHQEKFVRSKTRFTALIGGVRSGKTYAGAVKGIERALFLPTIGSAVAPTAAMARDVLVPQYAELLGERVEKWLSSNMEMTLRNGSKILFRSADNPDRLMGLTLDWFHLDEAAQLPKRVWEILVNRTISTGGHGFLTTTPRGRNWVFDLVRDWENDPDAEIIIAKTADNPQISEADIARARRQLDPKFFRQQYEASFETSGLAVYEDFAPESHVIRPRWEIRRDWPIYIGLDLGWTHPSAILWAQLSPDGRWIVFDELVKSHLRLDKVASAILGEPVDIGGETFRAKIPYSHVEKVICGLEGRQSRQEAGGESAVRILSGAGITRIGVYSGSIADGIHAVRSKLRSADGVINLEIVADCKRLIDDIQGYNYPSDADGSAVGELPEKDGIHDHTMDALRYMIDFVTPLTETRWQIG